MEAGNVARGALDVRHQLRLLLISRGIPSPRERNVDGLPTVDD